MGFLGGVFYTLLTFAVDRGTHHLRPLQITTVKKAPQNEVGVLKTIPCTKSSAKYTILKKIANNTYDKVLRKTKMLKFLQTMSVQNSSVKKYPVEISADVIRQKVARNPGGIFAKPTCRKGMHKKVTHKCNP